MQKLALLLRRDKLAMIPDLEWELKRRNSTLHAQTQRLTQEGYIVILSESNDHKTLNFTDEGRVWVKVITTRVLDEVPARELQEILETDGFDGDGSADYVDTYDRLLPITEEFGVYAVCGDSMISDGILAGDRIHLELGVHLDEPEKREKALVTVGENFKCTFKRIHHNREKSMVTRSSSNSAHPDRMIASSDVRVVAPYYGLIRVEDNRDCKEHK